MPAALQVALLLACVAVVLFVAIVTPLFVLLYGSARSVVRQIEELKADLKPILQDSRVMMQNVNLLAIRANQQLDELDQIVRVFRGWSECADQVLGEITAAVEMPIVKLARTMKTLRQFWRFIMEALFGSSRRTGRGEAREADEAAIPKHTKG